MIDLHGKGIRSDDFVDVFVRIGWEHQCNHTAVTSTSARNAFLPNRVYTYHRSKYNVSRFHTIFGRRTFYDTLSR